MKFKKSVFQAAVCCVLMVMSMHLSAGNDLPVNGDFKGKVSDKGVAQWELVSGKFRRLPTHDHDEFAVELSGKAMMRSVMVPVTGKVLKLEAEVSGSGMGRMGYAAFDRNGKLLTAYADGVSFSAVSRRSKVRASLPVADNAAFVAVVLVADNGSIVMFEDVDAEFHGVRTSGGSVVMKGVAVIPLANDRFYRFKELGNIPFGITLERGGDVEFDVEAAERDLWQVTSYDRKVCRVELEHDRKGIWPFHSYRAEVEIVGVAPGSCYVELTSTSGKKMKVFVVVESRR